MPPHPPPHNVLHPTSSPIADIHSTMVSMGHHWHGTCATFAARTPGTPLISDPSQHDPSKKANPLDWRMWLVARHGGAAR